MECCSFSPVTILNFSLAYECPVSHYILQAALWQGLAMQLGDYQNDMKGINKTSI